MRKCVRCGALHYEDATECREDGEALVESVDPRIGIVLGGRYTLLAPLGAGGMATVYRGAHVRDGRAVAIKMLHPHLAVDELQRERFRREIRAAAALAHPHIITVYDCGEAPDGCPYLVMELLQGKPLNALLKDGPLEFETVLWLGAQIAEAVARAHDLGVVHRDLKPANVFVLQDTHQRPYAKLVDFGLSHTRQDARLTMSGMVLGSPPYIAPEAIVRNEAGPSVDLYALGCLLFELAIGRPPFVRGNLPAMVSAHLLDKPEKPSSLERELPPEFDALVLSLLAKNPSERPADAHFVARALQAMQPSRPSLVYTPSLGTASLPAQQLPTPSGTVVLERWRWINDGLGKLLDAAFPEVSIPREFTAHFTRFREALERLEACNTESELARERADALEEDAAESRARFGHAVEALGTELSSAREQRTASLAAARKDREACEQAAENYRASEQHISRVRGVAAVVSAPNAELGPALRSAADAADRWLEAQRAFERSERASAESEARVRDMDFQVGALRERLTHTEEAFSAQRSNLDGLFTQSAARREEAVGILRSSASSLCELLRAHPTVHEGLRSIEASLRDPEPTAFLASATA